MNKAQIISRISKYATSRDVFNEMGEPILYDENDIWFFVNHGFACINSNKLKYLYTDPDYRNVGIADRLLGDINKYCIKNKIEELYAVCPSSALGFYKKRGFNAYLSFKNYHKIIKKYAK